MLAERVAKVQVAMHDHLADPHPAPAWLEVRPQRIDALVQAAAGGGVVDGRHGALQANPAAAGRARGPCLPGQLPEQVPALGPRRYSFARTVLSSDRRPEVTQ